ncbi:LysR family transcriptional regulator [Gluconobacter sphaericus]|uniref:Transcriptional regulator n=1 Tax=Gluconobacter sphaericus NBRC 12467 TaxID=1307951 RepID=A0AA37W8T3_9PROT|nr:LysR family transcriptional regulator [Gluconobacter sphaericus]MBF0884582.1 LysR family transcriptional regulator [Gluconobacter sphaericus]MBS1084720.1 LysR family transcriptional regulator [Gluconobacter sphaericus]MBS1096815.1 LysR family transcriptional regulator [Gluconobacter sphaericus]MBS1099890.1 LysR family transcriptional regulator [Gluconobacter sphaericus]QQX90505.1 LysR family transcriptional regulator [Gluconobacter sphaericus]
MNPLRLAQIEMFCAVVEEETVVAASRRLNCVASNVTARLKELELLLGQELFLRERGRLTLTPEGRLFYQQAMPVVAGARSLTDLFSEGIPRGVLNIGALDVALEGYLPRIVPEFLKACPGVELKMFLRPTYTLERMLADGEIDLALTDGPIVHPLMESRFAFREKLALAIPEGQKGAWDGQHVFLFNTDCFYRRYFEIWLERHGVSNAIIHTVESYDVILACVQAGLGISCVPHSIVSQVKRRRREGISFTYPEDLKGSEVYFIWREPGLNDLGRRFLDYAPTHPGAYEK